jgi:hypothetical protein
MLDAVIAVITKGEKVLLIQRAAGIGRQSAAKSSLERVRRRRWRGRRWKKSA